MDIKKADRAALKSYFVKNAIPTESNFADLIEAGLNQKEDGIAKLPGEPLSLQAEGADVSLKKVLNFYRSFAEAKPAWTLSLNPRGQLNAPASARAGLSVGDGDGNSRLFIDQATGSVGIGTVEPGGYRLHVAGPAFVNNAYLHVVAESAGRLRVGAAWGMPGLYSSDDGAKPLMLGVAPGQRVYLGVAQGDAFVEGGSGNAFFKGNVGVGVAPSAESLEIRGRLRAGSFLAGPWPANGTYAFVGASSLDQAVVGNYALLQGTADGPGRTYLNSPSDIRFRILNGDQMVLTNEGNFGIGHMVPRGKLHVQTGGAGAWDKFVVNTTQLWGDKDVSYVTIGEGGASGIMIHNPHVVWMPGEARASIRMGRSGGRPDGHWWDIGVRQKNEFSILNPQTNVALTISERGWVRMNVLQLGDKWTLSGVGDGEANDEWLRLKRAADQNQRDYWGGFAAEKLWARVPLMVSDRRLKKDVAPLEDATPGILKLRAVQFRWNDPANPATGAAPSFGLIAQEVESVFPEAVGDGPDGTKGINYALLVAPLIDVVQRQQAQIATLRAEVRALAAR